MEKKGLLPLDLRVRTESKVREDGPGSLNEQLFNASGDYGELESPRKAQGLVLYRRILRNVRWKENVDLSTRLRPEFQIPPPVLYTFIRFRGDPLHQWKNRNFDNDFCREN